MRKIWKRTIILVMILVVLFAAGSIIAINMKPEPPVLEIEQARQALALARTVKADTYAKETFAQAQLLYDSAMAFWNRENEKFFLKRDFTAVAQTSALSAQISERAIEESNRSVNDLETSITTKIKKLNQLVDEVKVLSRFPLPQRISDKMAKGRLALSEGEAAYDGELLIQANMKLTEAESNLKAAHSDAYKLINNYFNSYNSWKSWKAQTIKNSKNSNSTAILVDKFAGKCYVYKNGSVTHEFDAELGKNWIGDKRQKGDKVTPEGLYKITDKKEGARTKYHRALLINYPNDEDKKRFAAEIKNGTLPKKSKIGNLIEIHGHGGKGTDWTDGCVALTNKDMDKLYKLVQNGTPVTIIGSSITLDEILKSQK